MSSAHDFDFLFGDWRVQNRRLVQPLAGRDEWYTFDARTTERALWDGRANIEEYDATLPNGTRLRGLALRLYEPSTDRWTIHWSNGSAGTLDAPMTGTFANGVGEFFGPETCDGREVLARFRWTHDSHEAARWEQAYSDDDGATWETNWIMRFTRVAEPHALPPVIELRHYAHHPGARDTLIELFERVFVSSQEDLGMRVLAQFRDLDDPDAFTWLRGFPDMPSRAAALTAFYDHSEIWLANRPAANATLVDNDDVRLLRPVRLVPNAPGLVVATIYTLAPEAARDFASFFARDVMPRLVASGGPPVVALETEPSANTYPRLPVRAGERSFVWTAHFADEEAHARHLALLASDPRWTGDVLPALERTLAAPTLVWRLAPTAQSRVLA